MMTAGGETDAKLMQSRSSAEVKIESYLTNPGKVVPLLIGRKKILN